jgi:RHH-type proline utilization regulon transcriptional repressor/proline dehydrogenase/delta 1-pyrroline-5-carboxylate dehydrogenase
LDGGRRVVGIGVEGLAGRTPRRASFYAQIADNPAMDTVPGSEPFGMQDPLDLDEASVVRSLGQPLTDAQRAAALAAGRDLVRRARSQADQRPPLDAFLQEFGLSNPEGIALMCLAEALLRVPDGATADALIAEKLSAGDWQQHSGQSSSLFVNASTWALMLTGRLVDLPEEARGNPGAWLGLVTRRLGEPIVRAAVRRGMQIIGGEFVVGRSIDEALARCAREPALSLCSFDMLGEGARSDRQARRYLDAYAGAIAAIAAANRAADGAATGVTGPHAHSSISIKLSALDPCYSLRQREGVRRRLIPRVLELARLAAAHDLALTIDAEEADRLEMSLEVIRAIARDPATARWQGLGLALQAYGRRALPLVDWVVALAADVRRRIGVRLVKGAYWDSEIKRSQERGLGGYPVFTRKVSTDLSYLACAQRLFAAGSRIFPQFATHNAYTLAAVLAMRPEGAAFEFQRLHGMGELLYRAAAEVLPVPAVRVYAPVGPHEDLLAYLVRRLLENGANTSFVNRFMDESVPVEQVVTDPFDALAALGSIPNPGLPLPQDLYGAERRNSRGVDLGRARELGRLASSAAALPAAPPPGKLRGEEIVVTNPADRRERVATLRFAAPSDVEDAFAAAAEAFEGWNRAGADTRAQVLERAADGIEAARDALVPLLVREAGRTLADAVSEIREAADFCRYYAAGARRLFGTPRSLRGPTGESNELLLTGRGVMACISPWNFPLAIFTGQVAASLAAGNAVVAKPAESTPLVALAATALLHDAGVPRELLHCLPMAGRAFGEAAMRQPALAGVVFTGSTATAQWLNRAMAARDGAILPLVAETGGQNAMVVDSTALPEQVVDDVLLSAFGSAGQRCSALRVLCVQQDIADDLVGLLSDAMDELAIGDPADPATDVGPVISAAAALSLQEHVERMRGAGQVLKRRALDSRHGHGSFFPPHLIGIPRLAVLDREVFGPVLHVLRFRAEQLDDVLADLRRTGYGLTFGMHTRIDSAWRRTLDLTIAGNVYINRSMIGAVVGVQPFGGSGLSGTGPKAGGPHYLVRLANERTLTVNTTATGGNTSLLQMG